MTDPNDSDSENVGAARDSKVNTVWWLIIAVVALGAVYVLLR